MINWRDPGFPISVGRVLLFALSISALYAAGIIYRLPQGVAELAATHIVQQSVFDATIDFAVAALLGRLTVFVAFPGLLQILRVVLQLIYSICARVSKRRALRLLSRVLKRLDGATVWVLRDVHLSTLLLTFLIFAYLSTYSVLRAISIFAAPVFAFSLGFLVEEIKQGKLRLNFRKKNRAAVKLNFSDSSLITALAVFVFIVGAARLDSRIDRGTSTSQIYPGLDVVIVVSLEDAVIFATKLDNAKGINSRTWIYAQKEKLPITILGGGSKS